MLDPFALPTYITSIFNFVRNIFTHIQATMSNMNSFYGTIIGQFNTVLTQIGNLLNKLRFIQIVAFIIAIGKCLFKAFDAIVKVSIWIGYFVVWLFYPWPPGLFDFNTQREVTSGFLPWLVRFIICTSYKIMNFPKCFLWYTLDTAGWIFYLPFRFLFWLIDSILDIGLVKLEHDGWCFLDDLDYFIHGPKDNYFMYQYEDQNVPTPDPESLNTGYHIIHFPDTVMEKCYALNYYGLADLAQFPGKELAAFFRCALNPMEWNDPFK